MLRALARQPPIQNAVYCSLRGYAAQTTTPKKTSSKAKKPANAEGLSENCVKVPNMPVGPGAAKDKEYKNPEYFCYHIESFGEAEVELAKYRLPAPSNKKAFNA